MGELKAKKDQLAEILGKLKLLEDNLLAKQREKD
jgi:hypothetical protein